MDRDKWTYPGLSWEEEQKARAWEQLPQAEKDAQIEKARLDKLHYGWCQGCKRRILAYGRDWPKVCPHCGFPHPEAP